MALWKRWSGHRRMVLGMAARAGTRQHRTWVKHLSRALPEPPLVPRTGVVASAPQPSPPKSLPLPAAGATGCGAGCECPEGPCGVLQRGFSAPNWEQGHPILGRGHPAPHSGIKGPSSSSAEHTQTRDRSPGDGFPPALPLRCFPLSVVFSSFLGALRASLSCLWQRLKIAEEGKETLGFRSGMPR